MATPTGAGVAGAPRPTSQARVGGDQALVRAVEMSLGTTNRILKGPRGRMVVESTDPSIPLDRVPYFSQDLRKLSVIGSAMGALLIAGALIVPQLVK
jgi:hypothetical protein